MAAHAFLTRTNTGDLYGKPGLDVLLIETGLCRAVIALQGAQVLEFTAEGRAPLLWLSPGAIFESGRAVRGGVPLCLPWFGEHRKDPAKPKHGLVRNQLWELARSEEKADGRVEVVFTFQHTGDALFPTGFTCEFAVLLGRELEFTLQLANTSEETAEFSWALHTYFAVDDVANVSVDGLSGVEYLDKTEGLARSLLEGAQNFPGEVDRVFENAPAEQTIVTPNPIHVRSEHCDTVIVWNPGAELAATLTDVGPHYRGFVCVEHGNAFGNSWQLAAGEEARARLILSR